MRAAQGGRQGLRAARAAAEAGPQAEPAAAAAAEDRGDTQGSVGNYIDHVTNRTSESGPHFEKKKTCICILVTI